MFVLGMIAAIFLLKVSRKATEELDHDLGPIPVIAAGIEAPPPSYQPHYGNDEERDGNEKQREVSEGLDYQQHRVVAQ